MDNTWCSSGGPLSTGRRNSASSAVRSGGDRFIPRRRNSDFEGGYFKLMRANSERLASSDGIPESPEALKSKQSVNSIRSVLGSIEPTPTRKSNHRILSFSESPTEQGRRGSTCSSPGLDTSIGASVFQSPPTKATRHLSSTPADVMAVSAVCDRKYSQVLTWSSENVIIVPIESRIYCQRMGVNKCTEVRLDRTTGYDKDPAQPASAVVAVCASPDGKYVAIGTLDGTFMCYNMSDNFLEFVYRTPDHEKDSVSAICWESGTPCNIFYGALLCGCILQLDLRHPKKPRYLTHHDTTASVPGLDSSPDKRYVAVGTAVGEVRVLCTRQHRVISVIEEAHVGPIKAIRFCPWQSHLMATGALGGDGQIKLWNAANCKQTGSVQAAPEVRDLVWSETHRELISGHALPASNLRLWRYPDLAAVASLDAHEGGVYQMAFGPGGTTLLTFGADETLKFWDAFTEPKRNPRRRASLSGITRSPLLATIR